MARIWGLHCIPFTVRSIGSHSSSIPPRFQYLLRYYETAICPYLSALDDANPYVCHIIPLVQGSPSLQHAIAALSLNNMRMRKIQVPGSFHSSLNISPLTSTLDLQCNAPEPSSEELTYKATSIELLDQQLKDGTQIRNDAILATLLVLCLYHCSSSGHSKFRTQLAGVQKLINIRARSQRTSFICWVEMFFAWFDVLTSTVNNRETEIRAESWEMLDMSIPEGILEYHAGCDLHLFKLIAQLGRLNLLRQNRPVREIASPVTPCSVEKQAAKDFYSLNVLELTRPGLIEHQREQSPSEESLESQAKFWSEWNNIQRRLQNWESDISTLPRPARYAATTRAPPVRQRDMLHINEAFRYSALLYMQRLAKPSMASSASDMQSIVAQSLHHITQISVQSCMNKFLLWPLFITGAECINKTHRSLIQERCIKIYRESGFFNNLCALEVLRRVWMQKDQANMAPWACDEVIHGQPFKWKSAMNQIDGEYIII